MSAHEARLKNELAGLEKKYVGMARLNPISSSETKKHLEEIERIVSRMKAIRNTRTINHPVEGNGFLKELLYPTST